ncbi:DUF4232 domain-containing protein [Actinokineospora auranticolor]|nr:DUF4232 domain-containing protein [Actinokineospora auranticolor]
MRLGGKCGVVGASLLVMVSACGQASAASDGGVTSRVPQPSAVASGCPAEGVRITRTSYDGAMGLRLAGFEMANCGTEPYEVRGYPDVRLYDADGEPVTVEAGGGSLGIAVLPDFDAPPTTVLLQPGEIASTALLWRNLVTDSTVDATLAESLDMAPLAGRSSQHLTAHIDLGNTTKLGVKPWVEEARSNRSAPDESTSNKA